MHWLDWIGNVLGTPGALRALLVALVISWSLTQFIKTAPWITRKPEPQRRTLTNLIAFALGFAPAWLLWPERGIVAGVLATAIGAASPTAYKLAVRTLYHFWPWLEPKLSAAPRPGAAP